MNFFFKIIVDRDPRDQFLIAKYVLKSEGAPAKVDDFCKWYKYVRETKAKESSNPESIKFIQFEDLIYKYEETTKNIMEYMGLDEINHIAPKQIFDPAKSIRNTRLWEQNTKYKIEADEIANRLPEYLYEV